MSADLEDLTTLTRPQVEILRKHAWTITDLATADVKQLIQLKGIGKVTAERVVIEAAELINKHGLEDAERLARERYYQKAPPAKVLEDWEKEGLFALDVALYSASALALLKGITEDQALRIISHAQGVVNKEKLYESKAANFLVPPKPSSPAFPVEWLSGQVEPPPMADRIRRNFEKAKAEYEKTNNV